MLVHGIQILDLDQDGQRCSTGVKRFGSEIGEDDHLNTFGAMATWFNDAGYAVWVAHLDAASLRNVTVGTPSLQHNAACLRDQIKKVRQKTGQSQVVIVAHSMGGLVSRAYISSGDYRRDVNALYTIGSPHGGINALVVARLYAASQTSGVGDDVFCLVHPGICQFMTDQILFFNRTHGNRRDLPYTFIAGDETKGLLSKIIWLTDGPNDGIVGRNSAWGRSYPLNFNLIPRAKSAERYRVAESHTGGLGGDYTYFDHHNGDGSEAYRCVKDRLEGKTDHCDATGASLTTADTPALNSTTADVSGVLLPGQTKTHTLSLDTGQNSLIQVTWLSGTLAFSLTTPTGLVIDPAYAAANPDLVSYNSIPGSFAAPPMSSYALTNTTPSLYTMTITAGDVAAEGTGYVGFAALETDLTFDFSADRAVYQMGQTATFTAALQEPAGGLSGANVQVFLQLSNGATRTLTLTDQGNGLYRTTYTIPNTPGYVPLFITAGGDRGGVPFTRQANKMISIAAATAQLNNSYADRAVDTDGDGVDDYLAVDIGLTISRSGTYNTALNLTAGTEHIAGTAVYTTLASGSQTVTLLIDGSEIFAGQKDGPYTISNLIISDMDNGGIPSVTASDVWTTTAYKYSQFGMKASHRVYLPVIVK